MKILAQTGVSWKGHGVFLPRLIDIFGEHMDLLQSTLHNYFIIFTLCQVLYVI
jgi:hypothetical protein